jgi:microcystin-dependent protein
VAYNSATDFLALLRNVTGSVEIEQMPGLDYVVAALARAGFITVSIGQTPPLVNQPTTVWFQPQQPSWNGEGQLNIWNPAVGAYQNATPALWALLLSGATPSGVLPLMDATPAETGVSLAFARADHVHPTDTTRAPIASPIFIGEPQAPTPTAGDNSTNIATTAFVDTATIGLVPIGGVVAYAASAAPANFAILNGQAISRTTFAALFALIGTTYGSGDGSTTFNLPDLRGRVIAGVDGGANRLTTASMSSQTLAGVGGTESITLGPSQIPAHTHPNSLTDNGHVHGYQEFSAGSGTVGGGGSFGANVAANTNAAVTGITITNAANTGGGGSHLNVQPTMELTLLVRTN